MTIPKTVKYYANGAIYDSQGTIEQSYLSIYPYNEHIYFLTNVDGVVQKYNFYTKEYEQLTANIATSALSIVVKDDGVYGFNGVKAKPFKITSALYIKDDQYLVEERYDRQSTTTLLNSRSGIRDFIIDDDLNYIVLHGTTRVSKYSKTRNLLYTLSLSSINALSGQDVQSIAIDYINEYTGAGKKTYPIIFGSADNYGFFTKLDENTVEFYSTQVLPITTQYVPASNNLAVTNNLTNYTHLKNKYDNTEFTFRIKLANIYNQADIIDVNIPINTKLFSVGEHHFALRLDSIQGNISVFVDGKLFKNVTIPAGQYIFQQNIKDSIAVGASYLMNNVPLFKYLNQDNQYFINNCTMRQFKLYDIALNDNEIRFLVYNGIKMQDLIASIPSDQRNAFDQVQRLFKFDAPGNKSNSVNIKVKNSKISSPTIQAELETLLRDKLKDVLPVNTNINKINFT